MDNYIGQIEFFAFEFAPKGWAQCNGELLSVSSNQALFALLGTSFGGNGTTTFALPDLRGRIVTGPVTGPGSGIPLGGMGGEETHQLLQTEMPPHNHNLMADGQTAGSSNTGTPAANTVLGTTYDITGGGSVSVYASGAPNGTMAPETVAIAGAGAKHENRMPFVVLNPCIALTGVYPSRS